MSHYVPHTDRELAGMLAFIGLESLDQLFDMVPPALRLSQELALPSGLSEPDTIAELGRLAGANRPNSAPGVNSGDQAGNQGHNQGLVCFAGGGAYDHEIPSAVRRLAERSEFVTSYTPYQPEVAQGVLQALFEYQTLVARLTGREVANASLYDGATACVEAVNLAVGATGNHRVLLSAGLHPHWRAVLATMAMGTGCELVDVGLRDGVTAWPGTSGSGSSGSHSPAPAGAVLVQYPNYLGCLEDLGIARRLADATGARLIVAIDPVAAGLLHTAGSLGADVVVAEGQPFGTPLGLGGPYLGLFACRRHDVRNLPGRLVGQSVDTEGRTAYVTTLRTREQDIRREKASSNICTNQTLIAVTAAIQLSWLGTLGLRELALQCARGTRYAREALLAIPGVEPFATAPTLREFAVRTPIPPSALVDRMLEAGFLAGIALEDDFSLGDDASPGDYPGDNKGAALLVAVTERRTRAEIDAYVAAFEKAVR